MFGLNTLMESVSSFEDRIASFDPIFEASVELLDDDVKDQFIEDSVEADMAGDGISPEDEEKYDKILKNIPEYDENMEENIKALTESADFWSMMNDEYTIY